LCLHAASCGISDLDRRSVPGSRHTIGVVWTTWRAVAMGVDSGRHSYTSAGAEFYDTLGIDGTTYEIGFEAVRLALGDIQGRVFLDFGCGTGRSAAFLKSLGAGRVYGVDRDQDMIGKALARRLDGVVFTRIDEVIPLPDESVDGAVSLNVFTEIRTLAEMGGICREVARTVRPGRPFIVESTNPLAFGHTFRSYRYPVSGELRSGQVTPCIVTTSAGELVINDTYWTEDDYASALREAGLTITAIDYPMPRDPSAWSTDEAELSPCIVLTATKS
jgi:SAM-dependent methyltransferase